MKFGRLLLAGLGWVLTAGSPIGALLGYLVGVALIPSDDKRRIASDGTSDNKTFHHGPYRNTGSTSDVTVALLVLIAATMKADGAVKQSELNRVKEFLRKNYTEEDCKVLLTALRDIVKQDIALGPVCQQIKENTNYVTRYHMFDFLYGLAGVDNEYTPSEEQVLNTIRRGLGISMADFLTIRELHRGYSSYWGGYQNSNQQRSSTSNSSANPYTILGIEETATDDEIKRAYRKLAMKYHPDRMEGVDDSIKKNAEQQFTIITEAYETIKKARGIK